MFIFDFDGVLIDSVDELAVSAFNTVTDKIVMSVEDLPEGYITLFRLNRCRVQHAGEVPLLGRWCLENCSTSTARLLTREESETLFFRTPDESHELSNRFFATRCAFADQNHEAWLRLSPPFQPLWDDIRAMDDIVFLVLTYKNRRAVLDIFGHNTLLIKPEQIFSGDNGTRKEDNLRRIAENYPGETFYFIDDCLKNLDELTVAAAGTMKLVPLLAGWGYVAPEDREAAVGKGYPVLSQAEFLEFLKTHRESRR